MGRRSARCNLHLALANRTQPPLGVTVGKASEAVPDSRASPAVSTKEQGLTSPGSHGSR